MYSFIQVLKVRYVKVQVSVFKNNVFCPSGKSTTIIAPKVP